MIKLVKVTYKHEDVYVKGLGSIKAAPIIRDMTLGETRCGAFYMTATEKGVRVAGIAIRPIGKHRPGIIEAITRFYTTLQSQITAGFSIEIIETPFNAIASKGVDKDTGYEDCRITALEPTMYSTAIAALDESDAGGMAMPDIRVGLHEKAWDALLTTLKTGEAIEYAENHCFQALTILG